MQEITKKLYILINEILNQICRQSEDADFDTSKALGDILKIVNFFGSVKKNFKDINQDVICEHDNEIIENYIETVLSERGLSKN